MVFWSAAASPPEACAHCCSNLELCLLVFTTPSRTEVLLFSLKNSFRLQLAFLLSIYLPTIFLVNHLCLEKWAQWSLRRNIWISWFSVKPILNRDKWHIHTTEQLEKGGSLGRKWLDWIVSAQSSKDSWKVIGKTVHKNSNAESHPWPAKKILKKGEKLNTLSVLSIYCNVIRAHNIYLWGKNKMQVIFLIDSTVFTISVPSSTV